MDPVTHGLIGASVSSSAADSDELRLAALLGAAGAMLPDLDVLIQSSTNPLLQLEYHRQFSHSFAFAPVGALLVAGIFYLILKNKLSFSKIYLFSLLGILTAGIADTFTSYGVQLFWPLTDERFAWNLISIFDPIFSLGLIIAVGLALYRKRTGAARYGVLWVIIVTLFGLTQRQEARITAENLARSRNHFTEQVIVKPTLGNQLLWSSRYVSGGRLYADAVRAVPFSQPQVFQGEEAELMNWREQLSEYEGSVLYQDIRRFERLSDRILIQHPTQPNVIGDGRYSMLPTSLKPLWGIRVDTTQPGQHVSFETFRDASPEIRQKYWQLLSGEDIQ